MKILSEEMLEENHAKIMYEIANDKANVADG